MQKSDTKIMQIILITNEKLQKKKETVPKKAHKKCEAQKTNNTKPKTKTVDLLKMARETVTSVRSSLSALCSPLGRCLSRVGLSHRSLKIKPAPDSLPVRVKVTAGCKDTR